jgi:1-acyl-sn-glycerol-3-phosphate acyltransferase
MGARHSTSDEFHGQRAALPAVSPTMLRWFRSYSVRYIRRHFHSLRVSVSPELPGGGTAPGVIFLNHASWWDPLILLVLTGRFFTERTFYAPVDACALERYGILRKIGCFGVEQGSVAGARDFLANSVAVLSSPNQGLCITPQGRFADVRARPPAFQQGLGQIAKRFPEVPFVPLAIEYTFWEERLPEVLVRFGPPVIFPDRSSSAAATAALESALAAAQDALAADAIARDATRFKNLLEGGAGVGGMYDLWRRSRSWMRGERFQPEHSTL